MPTAIFAAISASSITTAIISFAISYVVDLIFAPDEPQAPADQGVQARVPTDPKNKLPVVYGEQRVAGQNIMADISADNQRMAFIIALSEGPVEAITSVTWEDKLITFNEGDLSTELLGVATTTTEEGETSGFLNGNLKCQVFPTGGPCTPMELFSSRWNTGAANRLMPNTAYAYLEITYNREDRVTGLPSRLFFNVRGRTVSKLQTDETFDSSTTMSTNPIDNLLDFLTNEVYGCSIPLSGLDLPSFYAHKVFCDRPIESTANNFCSFASNATTVANGRTSSTGTYGEEDFLPSQLADASEFNNQRDCEEATAFVGTASVSATWQDTSDGVLTIEKPRYTTNGVLNTNGELDRSISDLTVGNGGIFTYNLGKFGIISEGTRGVAARDGVSVSFSEDNIIGKLDITGSGFDAVLNECTLKFTSIRQKYQQEQVRVAYDQSLLPNSVQNPNEPRLEKTMQLPFTNNDVEARRIGRIIINDSRQALIVSFQANIDNTDLQAGDIIEIAHATPGWPTAVDITAGRAGKLFRIQQVDEKVIDQDNMSVGVSLIAREYASEVYTSETLLLDDPAPNTNFPNPFVIPDLNLIAADREALGTAVGDCVSTGSLNGTTTTEAACQADTGFASWVETDDRSASTLINGSPTSQIQVSWTNSTYLDTVEVRYIIGNLSAVNIAALADSAWTITSFQGEQASGILTNLEPGSVYQIQARPRNTLGVLGVFGPIEDAPITKIAVTTVPLDSIFEVAVNLTSNTGGSVFKNDAGEKELTATVTKVTEISNDLKAANTFNYLWKQDGNVICIDSNKNVIGVAALDLSIAGLKTFTQAQCEGAGGTFTAGTPAGTNNECKIGNNDIGNLILGCTLGNRADTARTGDTSSDKIQTITVQHDDVEQSSGFSCEVSNIELVT